MRPPAPWSRRFWRLPDPPSPAGLPRQELLRRDEPRCGGRVFSPGPHRPPAGTRPGWDWVPLSGAVERQDRAPGWVLWWLNLPYVDRWAHVWMWRHGCFEVEASLDPPPPPATGVREPRRPVPPSGSPSRRR